MCPSVSTFLRGVSVVLLLPILISDCVCVCARGGGGNVPLSALFGFPAKQGKLKFLP